MGAGNEHFGTAADDWRDRAVQPFDHGGFSTVQDGPYTVEELFEVQPELVEDTALNEWLEKCQEDGAYLLWNRQVLGGKDGEKQTLVGYMYLRGYRDVELDANGDPNYWGRVSLKAELTGIRMKMQSR